MNPLFHLGDNWWLFHSKTNFIGSTDFVQASRTMIAHHGHVKTRVGYSLAGPSLLNPGGGIYYNTTVR